ncbi:hypothetical protein DXG01_015582 [Tephrocybe rancida]|nr:hypothetical protein DXG01_015582 [Tephrocybe rancida]
MSGTPHDPPPPKTLSASIWAPQPQPSETTWPKTLDALQHYAPVPAPVRREDVFGPVPPMPRGVIGDGRKRSPPQAQQQGQQQFVDAHADTHVEQLLRTLNLSSPAPTSKKTPLPALSLDFGPSSEPLTSSPDFSPASATSSLLTPTDLSPTRFERDGKAYDITPYLQQPAPFERERERTHALESYIAQPYGHGLGGYRGLGYTQGYPFFEPFAETGLFGAQQQNHQGLNHQSQTLVQVQVQGQVPTQAQAQLHAHSHSLSQLNVSQQPLQPSLQPQQPLQSSLQSQQSLQSSLQSSLQPQSHQQPSLQQPLPRSPYSPLPTSSSPTGPARRLHNAQHPQGHLSQAPMDWRLHPQPAPEEPLRGQGQFVYQGQIHAGMGTAHEPINFLSLLHPASSPPYGLFVERIIRASDQQASIFLQQKLKVADTEERGKIVDAICARGFEMMAHRFGNWAVQRCLEAASAPDERRKMVGCMRGRVVELATNCYGCHVLQKALDCEEDIRLLIVSELLLGDPAQTLVNKHASHVWSKIMELAWTPPAPPIFAYVNKSLKGKWASLACHETGSLVVQHAFENLEAEAKDGIVDELINSGPVVFAEVAKNQWGSYCVQHILEHGSEAHRTQTLQHLLDGLLDFASSEQGAKSVTKALKEGGKATLDRIVGRMCEAANGSRRAMIVDLALSVTGSQLIASVLPTADKDQRALLYDCIRGHIVTLRGCKTGSKDLQPTTTNLKTKSGRNLKIYRYHKQHNTKSLQVSQSNAPPAIQLLYYPIKLTQQLLVLHLYLITGARFLLSFNVRTYNISPAAPPGTYRLIYSHPHSRLCTSSLDIKTEPTQPAIASLRSSSFAIQ